MDKQDIPTWPEFVNYITVEGERRIAVYSTMNHGEQFNGAILLDTCGNENNRRIAGMLEDLEKYMNNYAKANNK